MILKKILFSTAAFCAMNAYAQLEGAPLDTVSTETHHFFQVAPDVYFATPTGTKNLYCNAMVIVSSVDVLVVDSHASADAAQALISSIAEITDLPVRFLVNTHYHWDHAHGNQSFPESVQIVGHEYTRAKLLGGYREDESYQTFGTVDAELRKLRQMEEQVAESADDDHMSALRMRMEAQQNHIDSLREFVPIPPDITLERKLTIFRGEREIQLLFLGRGHTGGDVVVYLPSDRIIFSGDLLQINAGFMADAYPSEWIDTLESLKLLDFGLVLPGHGEMFSDRSLIDRSQNYLRDFLVEVKSLYREGVEPKEAATRFPMEGYEDFDKYVNFPMIREVEVRRVYNLIESGIESP